MYPRLYKLVDVMGTMTDCSPTKPIENVIWPENAAELEQILAAVDLTEAEQEVLACPCDNEGVDLCKAKGNNLEAVDAFLIDLFDGETPHSDFFDESVRYQGGL